MSAITQDSLRAFASTARLSAGHDTDEENASFGASRGTRARGSMASVLDMMSLTLAVEPSSSRQRGPVPLRMYSQHKYYRIKTDLNFQKLIPWTT